MHQRTNDHHPHPQQDGNPLCQQIGHLWDSSTTVVNNYRRCTRAQCHTAERLVGGRWRAVSTRTRTRTPSARQPSVVQPTLFRPGVDFSDPREERRAERALFDLLRH